MSLFDDDRVTTRGQFPCPWCGEDNDAATSIRDPQASPRPGDTVLCIKCARPAIIQEVGKPRKPTEGEWAELNADEHITQLRKAIFMEGAKQGRVHYEDVDVRPWGG